MEERIEFQIPGNINSHEVWRNDEQCFKATKRIVDIASELGIAQATANKTIQRLQSQGFIKREPYRSIFLTLKGQKIASKSKKRHNIVYNFLI